MWGSLTLAPMIVHSMLCQNVCYIYFRSHDIFWLRGRNLPMMAVLLGRIDQFDPEQEQYVERLEQFFKANEITGEGKAAKWYATFLSVMGPAPYQLLRSLLSPIKPTEKSFEELVAVLTAHYNPPLSEVMQRFWFNSRSRKTGESVAPYVAELRRLTEFCNESSTASTNNGSPYVECPILPVRKVRMGPPRRQLYWMQCGPIGY